MTEYAKNFGDMPKLANNAAKTSAVNNSTSGYLQCILVLQNLHLPPRKRKLNTGILSYQNIFLPHLGQCDAGNTIDLFFGIL
jgi:hypothetical protein